MAARNVLSVAGFLGYGRMIALRAAVATITDNQCIVPSASSVVDAEALSSKRSGPNLLMVEIGVRVAVALYIA